MLLRRIVILFLILLNLSIPGTVLAYSEDIEAISGEISGGGRLDWPVPTPPAVMTSACTNAASCHDLGFWLSRSSNHRKCAPSRWC